MRIFIRILFLGPVLALIASCTDVAPRGGGDILVLGDSVMAWNGTKGAAIGDAMGRKLDREVVSKAVPGAQFSHRSGLASGVGFDIQAQYPGGTWNWVVMDGGANDLSADCGCGACGATVDAFISADGASGSIPSFMQQVRRQSGARVMWMGYYAGNGKGSFEGCRGDLVRMEQRLARYAAATEGVYFVDAEDVIDPRDPSHFASDNTHPSVKGSAVIAAYLAQQMNAAEGRSQTGQ